MYNISRFLPGFGDAQTGSAPSQQSSHTDSGDDLLGLQRVLRDAQNPRRPVIGMDCLSLTDSCIDAKQGSWIMLPGASLARMVARMGYDVSTSLSGRIGGAT